MFERATVVSALLVFIGLVWGTMKYYKYINNNESQIRVYFASLSFS